MELGAADFQTCDGWSDLPLGAAGVLSMGIKQANKMIATKNREDAEAHLLSVEDPNPAVTTDL